MKLDIWSWFQGTWDSMVGKAIKKLTEADGEPGLSWKDIQITAELIKQAETDIGTGAERKVWVQDQMKKIRNIVLPHLSELAFWAALNFAKQKGWVHLGGGEKK